MFSFYTVCELHLLAAQLHVGQWNICPVELAPLPLLTYTSVGQETPFISCAASSCASIPPAWSPLTLNILVAVLFHSREEPSPVRVACHPLEIEKPFLRRLDFLMTLPMSSARFISMLSFIMYASAWAWIYLASGW